MIENKDNELQVLRILAAICSYPNEESKVLNWMIKKAIIEEAPGKKVEKYFITSITLPCASQRFAQDPSDDTVLNDATLNDAALKE